jgi:hypothetical protein
MIHVVVEREFEGTITVETLRAAAHAGRWCFDQHQVRHLGAYMSNDGRRLICLFEAPDLESVRVLNEAVGLPSTTTWAATVHEPPPAAETGQES